MPMSTSNPKPQWFTSSQLPAWAWSFAISSHIAESSCRDGFSPRCKSDRKPSSVPAGHRYPRSHKLDCLTTPGMGLRDFVVGITETDTHNGKLMPRSAEALRLPTRVRIYKQ